MPTKKTAKKSAKKKTLLQKVGTTASNIKEEIVAGTENVVDFAGEAFTSIKEGVKHLVEKKKPKKAAKKKATKKVAVKKSAKKAAPKKTAKKQPGRVLKHIIDVF